MSSTERGRGLPKPAHLNCLGEAVNTCRKRAEMRFRFRGQRGYRTTSSPDMNSRGPGSPAPGRHRQGRP
jgi:hypothetical protein